jgi:hypothetical protein
LAVQAATGTSRHVSLFSLIKLQRQLCLESDPDEQIGSELNSRLSRIVTKLFARVLKAEESLEDPYNIGVIDLDLLLRGMEGMLQACRKNEQYSTSTLEQIDVCKKMVTDLVCSFLEAHHGNISLQQRLVSLGFKPRSTLLETVISECEAEVDLTSDLKHDTPAENMTSSSNSVTSENRRAQLDPLGDCVPSTTHHVTRNDLKNDNIINPDCENGKNMTARIQTLKSRVSASELVVQTVVDDKGQERFDESPRTKDLLSRVSSSVKQSKLSAPSPSRISLPSAARSRVSPKLTGSSSQTLRDRLTASQETRRKVPESSVVSNSLSRAAALRARLEAVKQQGGDA